MRTEKPSCVTVEGAMRGCASLVPKYKVITDCFYLRAFVFPQYSIRGEIVRAITISQGRESGERPPLQTAGDDN